VIGWRTPGFWWRSPPTLAARLLRPVGETYGAQTATRMRRRGVSLGIPVITVGAFALGGPGKTPTVEAVARLLIAAGEAPAIIARGYGSKAARQRAPTFVNPAKHGPADVGDEPLILVRTAPVIAGSDRIEAAWLARRAIDPSVLVLDDGLQSRQIEPDLAIAVVDDDVGIGNGLCVPAGPLRAPLPAQLPFADAILLVGRGKGGGEVLRGAAAFGKPVFTASLTPKSGEDERFAGTPVIAFAGIGRPQKFFATLGDLGADIRAQHAFPDHHAYTPRELTKLRSEARGHGARLVTTEKDMARLSGAAALGIEALAVELLCDDADAFAALLRSKTRSRSTA
jgi:tetraacyldisaccharide 4'-kinase